jgi:hypothetical protein
MELACKADIISFVKLLLEREYQARATTQIVQEYSTLQRRVITEDASTDEFVKRWLYEITRTKKNRTCTEIELGFTSRLRDFEYLQGLSRVLGAQSSACTCC